MYDGWPLFRTLLDNLEMALMKADLGIGRRYADLEKNPRVRARVFGGIEAEFRQLVNLADQLELRLAENAGDAQRAAVRSQAPTQVAPGFEESVAEYYRRLSRSDR